MELKFSEISEFRKSDKSLKHKWGQFKDHVSGMCPADTIVASWSLTQMMTDLNPFTVMINIFGH